LSESWLHEVFVTSKERLHPTKKSYFINLTAEEREAVLRGSGLPVAKLVMPETWSKSGISSIPYHLGTDADFAVLEDEQ
jgi:hypothetical protein